MTRRTIRTAATCSVLALATVMLASPAAAQVASGSFQGTPSVTFGNAVVTEGAGTTDVQVNSNSAVIDWSPDDTGVSNGSPILFQPAGTTATFHNDPTGQNDFAVLNRIVPVDASRPIVFDGTVISRLQTSLGQVPGGTVFFYSPGGIIVGANAVFDVGNLGLTSAPPAVDGNGNWYTGNQVQFGQAAAGTSVRIEAGAQIIATAENSYVAAFAPQVVQAGTISVNGQAALVGAEAGTITFSPDGLFNIQVTIGSDETFAIDHRGTTTGPASSGAGDNHRIYMVAVPKNTAVQLAIGRGSEIGFDVAGAADTVGNAVILSAGRNIAGGMIGGVAGGAAGATLDINDSNSGSSAAGIEFTSAVTGSATNNVFVNVFNQTNFASDASFQAEEIAQVSVGMIPTQTPGALTVGGDLTLSTDRFVPFSAAAGDAGQTFLSISDGASADVAGSLILSARAVFDTDGDGVVTGGLSQLSMGAGGTLDVGGDMLIRAGAFTDTTAVGLDAIGGVAQAYLFGGSSLSVAGVTRITTFGLAGFNNGMTGSGANGTGGFSTLFIAEGSSANFNEFSIVADGVGGADTGAGAGDGFGGSAQVHVEGAGSTITIQQANVTGDFNLGELDLISAEGIGGATGLSGATGGTGTGGTASLLGIDAAVINLPTVPSGPDTLITARGYGGSATADGATGGLGVGGNMSVRLDNATASAENLVLSVSGVGGLATASALGIINGGDAVGGSRSINIVNGSTFTGAITGGASGGSGGNANANGTGGSGSGGSTFFELDNSTINATGAFIVIGQSQGGTGRVGGNANAGTVNAVIRNGSTVNIASSGEFSFSANAFGGTDPSGNGTVGGNGIGGVVQVTVQNSAITGSGGSFGALSFGQAGFGGAQGGVGAGGFVRMAIQNSSISVFEMAAIANGIGGDLVGNANSAGGASGDAFGGNAGINLTNSTINADSIEVRAEGSAGVVDATGFTGLTGGSGAGGTAFFQALGGVTDVTTSILHVDSQGSGGRIFAGTGTAGTGTGGQAYVRSSSGTFTINGLVEVTSEGDAGSAAEGGVGGSAFGGNSDVTAGTGGSLVVNGSLTVLATAEGGDGTTGGEATGGSVVLNADAQTLTVNGQTFLSANADGGFGGIGGTGAGGVATGGSVLVIGQNGGALEFADDVNADSSATGGSSLDGDGGAASGGNVRYLAQSGGSIVTSNAVAGLTAISQATGGNGGGLGNGGDAFGGVAQVTASGGGALNLAGDLTIDGASFGGSGVNGGSATNEVDPTDAEVLLFALNGTITVAGVTEMNADAIGGSGSEGGAGGAAQAGNFVVRASTNPNGPSSVTLADLIGSASAEGGDGGDSASGAGGTGGQASGGFAGVFGTAGSGTLTINGITTVEANATGGDGGAGATGGAAGSGLGGFIEIGTLNGQVTADNLGSATFVGDVFAFAAGSGGFGGAASAGVGGAGGNGEAGSVALALGSPVTLGNAQLLAYGIGGDGGTGTTGDGGGGDGIVGNDGGIGIFASNRAGVPEHRGTLTAGTIIGQAIAIGGAGSTVGAGLIADSPALISFNSSEGSIGTLDIVVSGTEVVGAAPDQISLTDATVNISDFFFSTSTDLVLALDGAVLNTDLLSLQAREIVLPDALPNAPGTINVSTGLELFVDAGGSIRTYADFNTGFGVSFTVDGDFQTGDFTANGDIFIELLTGTITTRDLTGDTISLLAAQGILASDIEANGDIFLQTDAGTISVGTLSGTNVIVSAPQDVVIGDFASDGDVVLESLTGSLTTGNLSGANVDLFAANNLSVQNITTAGFISAQAGGVVTVGGTWAGGSIAIAADDIAITSAGLLNGNQVEIISTNSGGMFVGDGTSGSGFVLDNAEFNRIIAGDVTFGTVDTSGEIDLTVGDLTVSSNRIGGAEEAGVEFFVIQGSSESSSPGGGIRVDGNVVATGFGDEMEIEFFSNLFELNAETGSVSISGDSSSAIAGEIEIEANHIHVASADILQKLRADPLYEGRVADLNAPAQVQRPEGVLRARAMEFYPGSTLYIQNTGTAANPAGFYTTAENSDIEPPGFEDPEAPPVDVIINGQFQTATGDVGGREAFDLLIANAESSDGFTATSQLNACTISTSACTVAVETPAPLNTSEIQVLTEDQAQEEPFDTEDEEEAEEEAASPIAPPVVLINSRPLNPDVDVTDPVSGTGNPALIDATLSDDTQGDQQ